MKKSSVLIATRQFGVRSQIWMWRQIGLLSKLRASVLSWTNENPTEFPLPDSRLHVLATEQEPNDGNKRWGWRLRNLPSGNFYGTQGQEKKEIDRIFREETPSVILAHFGYVGLRLLPAALTAKVPLVVHFHGLDISSGLQNRWYRHSLKKSIPHLAAAICVGSHQIRELVALGMPEDRIHLIPCGVPTDEFQLRADPENINLTFICVSRLVEWKGVHHVLDAFALVHQTAKTARLVVVGDGPETEKLRSQSKQLGLNSVVTFTGSQSQAQVKELLTKADVFLQHSLDHHSGWSEGFGVSIAEASAMGIPVIVSRCGGIPDQVIDGETGLIVEQRNHPALAQAMLSLADDPQKRRQLGLNGRQRMIDCFDTKSQVQKLEAVLLGAISRSPSDSSGG